MNSIECCILNIQICIRMKMLKIKKLFKLIYTFVCYTLKFNCIHAELRSFSMAISASFK